MESKPILWDKSCEVLQPLRQPNSIQSSSERCESNMQWSIGLDSNTARENRNSHIKLDTSNNTLPIVKSEYTTKDKKMQEIIARSTLKVDAPEWYPPSLCSIPPAPTSTVQDRLKVYKKPVDTSLQNTDKQPHRSSIPDDTDNSVDIIRLKQILNTLTKDPGQFNNLLDLFLETSYPYFKDIFTLSIITQLLVEQAINNSNFRYTGARLCWYIEQNSPEFRAELHLKCKKQLEDNVNKQNVLLFIAELYTQLPHLNVYGALLIESFKQLLEKGGNDNIKCICQALKLTGYSLEQNNKTSLDQVFAQLKSVANTLNGSAAALLNSVVNLRNSNWGYSSDTTATSDHAESELDEIDYEGLPNTDFYHVDGHQFTNEEKGFLAAHMDSNAEYLSDNSDPDELYDPEPEMDEDIQAAFREFVKYCKN